MATRPGYIWSGTEWVSIGQEATVNPFAYQASEPISPATGDVWIDSDDTIPTIDSAQFLRWRKTVAGGETSLSGNDDTSLPLQYTAGYEQLYINGVLQVRTLDYVATTGTTITGLTALALNDVVEIFSVVARLVGDVYTQAQADAKYATQATVSALPAGGLTLINTTTFSAVASQSVNDVFTSTYANYKIDLTITAKSTSGAVNLRYRVGGTDNATSNYFLGTSIARSNNTIDPTGLASQTSFIMIFNNADQSAGTYQIYSPQLANNTLCTFSSFGGDASAGGRFAMTGGSVFAANTVFDGFTVLSGTGTITGTVRVYGIGI
jgi:hypothetical protein